MGYSLRWTRTNMMYEVTVKTIQGRYLLRPSREVRDVILGVISQAQSRYAGIALYAFVFTRNEATLLLSSSDETQMSRFMCYVLGSISRRLGRLLDWSGKLWHGRYRAVPILDEEAITLRLRHVLARGVDEGLIESPKDWPGATCVPALLDAMTLEGTWVDHDRQASLRAAGLEPPPSAYVHPYRVTLTPLPAWAALPRSEQQGRYRAMIDSIEFEHLVERQGPVLGLVELQAQDPFSRPPTTRRARIAALCHSTSTALVDGFRAAYRAFCAMFRAAARAVTPASREARALVAAFPAGCNPRPELHVPLASDEQRPWWNQAPAEAPPVCSETIIDDAVADEGADPPTVRWVRPAAPQPAPPAAVRSTAPTPTAPARPRPRRAAGQPTRELAAQRSPPRD
ncbi:MAG TPA: hypothetical protein VHE35_29140 [Kofleriaceae bacterium]|nr:hypothetical protein [Kofleriaceae bacterium]